MTEMVERVAKAIYDEWMSVEENPRPWDKCSYVQKSLGIAIARAAIATMREPTKEMVEKGIRGATGGVMCSWQMMIDEALK